MVAITVVMGAVLTAQMNGYLSVAPQKTPTVGIEQSYGEGNYSLTVVSVSGPVVKCPEVTIMLYSANGTVVFRNTLDLLQNGTQGKLWDYAPTYTLSAGDNIVLTSPDCQGGTGVATNGCNVRLFWKGSTIANVVLF